mgnify:CR=1 FL=1
MSNDRKTNRQEKPTPDLDKVERGGNHFAAERVGMFGVAGEGFNTDTVGKKPAGDVLAGVAEGAGNDV